MVSNGDSVYSMMVTYKDRWIFLWEPYITCSSLFKPGLRVLPRGYQSNCTPGSRLKAHGAEFLAALGFRSWGCVGRKYGSHNGGFTVLTCWLRHKALNGSVLPRCGWLACSVVVKSMETVIFISCLQ